MTIRGFHYHSPTPGPSCRAIHPLISEAKMANSTTYGDQFRYLTSLEARPTTTRRHIREYQETEKGFIPQWDIKRTIEEIERRERRTR